MLILDEPTVGLDAAFAADVLVIVGVTIAALGLGAPTPRRRTG